jgi:hypothetical protein
MGKAIDYTLTVWDGLRVFLEDGRVEIDNNEVENAIRSTAVGKKNWLFIGDAEAGERKGLDPFGNLRDVFSLMPTICVTFTVYSQKVLMFVQQSQIIVSHILFIMHKLAFYTLTFGALSLAACTQSPPTQSSANGADIFNGEVWLRDGQRAHHRKGGTLYLRDAKSQELPENAYSISALRSMFGMKEVAVGTIRQKKVYYISE